MGELGTPFFWGRTFPAHCCMSSEVPVVAAANLSATEDPPDEGEGTADAEGVENLPSTVEAVTRPVVFWADI